MEKDNKFSGKILIFTNVNGKQNRVEKDFSNEDDFINFIEENNVELPSFSDFTNSFERLFTPARDFFEALTPILTDKKNLIWVEEDIWVDLREYEKEIKSIEQEKESKSNKIKRLETAKEQLKEYIKTFESEWKGDLKKKVDEELKSLKKESK